MKYLLFLLSLMTCSTAYADDVLVPRILIPIQPIVYTNPVQSRPIYRNYNVTVVQPINTNSYNYTQVPYQRVNYNFRPIKSYNTNYMEVY